MTSTDNTLELIEAHRNALFALRDDQTANPDDCTVTVGLDLLCNVFDLGHRSIEALTRHHKLAIAAGYPEGVEAMAEGVKAMREALEYIQLAGHETHIVRHARQALTGEPA